MRREELYLRDIIEAADHLSGFVSHAGAAGLSESEMVRSSILQKLTVIGEAASKVSEDLWRKIVAFWNVVVYGYFGIDWDIAWHAATSEVPGYEEVEVILRVEFGEGHAET